MNKRGWIHILEATIAVMLVAGVMMTVYSGQSVREELSVAEYSYNLQSEILEGITINENLRRDILLVADDSIGSTDPYYINLDSVIAAEIPESFGHHLRVCNLGDIDDVCNIPPIIFRATLDKDVFVEESVISSDIGDGVDEAIYSPKKIRLFLWEGDISEENCYDECVVDSLYCSIDVKEIVTGTCEDSNGDGCLERNVVKEGCGDNSACDTSLLECVDVGCSDTCSEGLFCSGGNVWETTCVDDGGCLSVGNNEVVRNCDYGCSDGVCGAAVDMFSLNCEKRENFCVESVEDEAEAITYCNRNGYDNGNIGSGQCSQQKTSVECWSAENTGCSESPSCSSGFSETSRTSCDVNVPFYSLNCESEVHRSGCISQNDNYCESYTDGTETGCGFGNFIYDCWSVENIVCSESPSCSSGFSETSRTSCW